MIRTAASLVLLAGCGRFGFESTSTDDAVGAGDAALDDTRIEPGATAMLGYQSGGTEELPAVAWDGSRFVVAWLDDHARPGDNAIAGNTLTPSGQAGIPTVLIGAGFIRTQHAGIACNTNGVCGVVTGDVDSSGSLACAMFTNGTASPRATLINQYSFDPGIASIGTEFLVAYGNSSTTQTGVLLMNEAGSGGSPVILETTVGGFLSAAATPSRYLATWVTSLQIRYVTIDPAGQVVGAVSAVPGANTNAPRVAASDDTFLLVWVDTGVTVKAARIAENGMLLDIQPLTLGTITSGGRPTTTWDGRVFLVAWETGGMIVMRTVDAAGVVEPETTLMASAAQPALGSDRNGTTLLAFARAGGIEGLVLVRQ